MNARVHTTFSAEQPSIYSQVTIVSIALLALIVLWASVEPRLLDGVSVWEKPAKFALSFVVHFATLAIIVAAMSKEYRERTSIAVAGGVMAAAFMGEMAS